MCGAVVHAGALDEEVAGGQGSRSVATALLLHLFATVHAHDFVTGGGGTERRLGEKVLSFEGARLAVASSASAEDEAPPG